MKNKIIIPMLGLSLITSLYAKDSGFYVGGTVGSTKTQDSGVEYDRPTGATNGYLQNISSNDLTYGALLGYDFYFDNFLVGLEFDMNKINSKEKETLQTGGANGWFYNAKVNNSASLRLRLGYLADSNDLLYVSYGRAKANITGKMYNETHATLLKEFDKDVYGDQFSIGLEHFYENNLSLQIDLKNVNYDQFDYNVDQGATQRNEKHDLSARSISLAIKYKF